MLKDKQRVQRKHEEREKRKRREIKTEKGIVQNEFFVVNSKKTNKKEEKKREKRVKLIETKEKQRK